MTSRPPLQPTVVAAVAAGGALGAVLRHLLSSAPDRAGVFPWTTFAVNVAGCALLAVLPSVAALRSRPLLAPVLGPGLLGGFTTMSAYGEQSRALAASGHPVLAGAYVIGTLVAALAAVLLVGTPSARPGGRDLGRGPVDGTEAR